MTEPDDDIKILDCARCGRMLLAPDQPSQPHYPEPVAGRAYGRPHCWRCLPHAMREPKPRESFFSVPIPE